MSTFFIARYHIVVIILQRYKKMLITAEKAIDILSLYMNFFQQLLMGGA